MQDKSLSRCLIFILTSIFISACSTMEPEEAFDETVSQIVGALSIYTRAATLSNYNKEIADLSRKGQFTASSKVIEKKLNTQVEWANNDANTRLAEAEKLENATFNQYKQQISRAWLNFGRVQLDNSIESYDAMLENRYGYVKFNRIQDNKSCQSGGRKQREFEFKSSTPLIEIYCPKSIRYFKNKAPQVNTNLRLPIYYEAVSRCVSTTTGKYDETGVSGDTSLIGGRLQVKVGGGKHYDRNSGGKTDISIDLTTGELRVYSVIFSDDEVATVAYCQPK
jgi:hypothetical protein